MYCRIVLREATRAFDREYTYAIPDRLSGLVEVGSWVQVPFGKGNRSAEGYVTSLMAETDMEVQLKPVSELLAPRPVLLPRQLDLAAQMRSRYLCSFGDALKCMVPAAVARVKDKTVRVAFLIDPEDAARQLADGELTRINHVRVVELLLENGSAPLVEIMHACHVSRAVLTTLEKKGLIRVDTQEMRRELADEHDFTPVSPFAPTPDQAVAISRIADALRISNEQSSGCHEHLLFGITGSGKTEVYLQCAQIAADQGRGVVILVPEIALTPQMISRIRSRFGTAVAVLHSRLTPAERYEQWQRILRQEVRVVVGARSAIFAPLDNIGLVVIDEEQETTYKSETHPRYHARDIARMLAQENGSVLVLGSATPSVESYHRAQSGHAILLKLGERIGSAKLPKTQIIDMRRELGSGNRSIFSRALDQAMREAFEQGHQAMILINRRGYAGFILCRDCGHVVKCHSCSVSLTSHINPHANGQHGADSNHLVCHYCGRISRQPKRCPVCNSAMIGRFGAGTQQVEELFNQQFAPRTALRMDQDTTVGRNAHAKLLAQFEQGKADALIGTQMIAKGHDFHNVTVSAILSADLMLGVSDFRASERAFQLITQAAGRAGRGSQPGKVIIQAYNVDDYAILHAAAQDYPGFFQQEIAFRKAMKYPPFGSIASMTFSAAMEAEARDKCRELHSALSLRQSDEQSFETLEIMDPARAPLYRIKDRYRWRLIVKGPGQALLTAFLTPVTDHMHFGKVAFSLDLDPYQML